MEMRSKRLFLHRTNALVMVVLALVLVVLANYVAYRHSVRFDVTKGRIHSISPKTVKVLKGLGDDNEIEVIGFFKEIGADRKEFRELTAQYERVTDRVRVRVVDPDKEPGLARRYEVKEYGTVVVRNGEDHVKVRLSDPLTGGLVATAEQELTNAIVRLTRGKKKKVYFLVGHGERDPDSMTDPKGLGKVRKALEEESYEPDKLMLLAGGELTAGEGVLVVAAPLKRLEPQEVEAIKRFLDSGGAALFALEPWSGAQLVDVLEQYGIKLRNDVVIDPSSKLVGGGDVAPIVATYPPHDITRDFKYATIFPFSRSMDVESKDGISAQLIAKTSQYAWSETDLARFRKGEAELGPEDLKGPLGVAAVSRRLGKGGGPRIVVFGSADMISNRFFEFSGNADLFLNSIEWLAGDEDLISIRPRQPEAGRLNITPAQQEVIFVVTVLVLPLVILALGIATWIKRRTL